MSYQLSSLSELHDFVAGPAREFVPLRTSRMSPPDTALPAPRDERQAEDAALLHRMAQGDKAACATLYDRFSRPLYSLALRILNDETEAEDVVQDVFLALWEKAPAFATERGSAFAWAVTLTRHRAIDRLRTRRRRAELLATAAANDDLSVNPHALAPEVSADLAAKEQSVAVRAAVARLPDEQKHALELAFFGGLTQQEIAERLRQPLGTIKARIRRGLLKLRDTLARRHD